MLGNNELRDNVASPPPVSRANNVLSFGLFEAVLKNGSYFNCRSVKNKFLIAVNEHCMKVLCSDLLLL